MLNRITNIFSGDPVQKLLDSHKEIVEKIANLEPAMQALSDEALKAKSDEFRSRLAQGETLEDILPEAFAVVREVSVRTIGMRHFDVQMLGGIILHEGTIVEMKTGEGKTLVATLPIYLNALQGKGVHLVTVNDYLARRDARWMGPIFHFLGLSVGVLQEAARTEHGRKAFLFNPDTEATKEELDRLDMVDRAEAYAADVTYGTNNEFGFDYLRDNMARTLDRRVQRSHHYAILDEVDNILIDEARTPLIISGPSHDDPELYIQMARVVDQLKAEDYEVSEKDRTIVLTEIGEDHVEQLLNQPLRDPDRPEDITPEQARLLGHLEQALRAKHLFKRNKHYVVQGGRVIIVDEFTGRMMAGRRWSDGLHQAVEAKEGVKVRQENVTYATITLQNYFRMYDKLAGMTGTAVTEAEEFNKIYDVDVLPLPTNLEYIAEQPDSDLAVVDYQEDGNKFTYYARSDDPEQDPVFWRRKDYADVVYRTEEAKMRSVAMEILRRNVLGQPLLVGTTSVELSERLSERLRAEMLNRLMTIQILRDAYLEAHDIPDDGVRVDELEFLNQPLTELNQGELRPLARELDISLNPTHEANLARLIRILELDPDDAQAVVERLQGGIRHAVLNAKKHDEESAIIAGAGALGGVTIATNMAGRGVDIKLGGELAEEVLAAVNRVLRRMGIENPEVLNLNEREEALREADKEAIGIYKAEVDLFRQHLEEERQVRQVGGLHVIGSERHESRRIDNQLRGRAARQGDPGSSQFFLSLEDELMRLFAGQQVSNLMQRLKIDDAIPLAHNLVNRTIEQAQTRVEGAHFDTRKHLLEYDDVLNQQREVFYSQRNRVFAKDDLSQDIESMLLREIQRHVEAASVDPDGKWKLLAWLEETQPTLNLETDHPYPSYMLRLLLDELSDVSQPDEVKTALLAIAQRSLDAQGQHLRSSLEESLERALERLDDQVQNRFEMADMAIEGAIIEAEEFGQPVDPKTLIGIVEQTAGLRIQMDAETIDRLKQDPRQFRRHLPNLVESSMGLRIWTGLIQTVERRLGQSLELDNQMQLPIDWDVAEETLREAFESKWSERTQSLVGDIERDLENNLGSDRLDEKAKLQQLVQMSYGQVSFFDPKTHQRRSAMVARMTYTYAAADLVTMEDEELTNELMGHLEGARQAIQLALGWSELMKAAAQSLTDLDENVQANFKRALGDDRFQSFTEKGTITDWSEAEQEEVAQLVGNVILSRVYRDLILSVGDRAWVDYLTSMEALRTSIGLEAYGQRDPLVQYKSRAFDMFSQLLADIQAGVVSRMFRFRSPAQPQAVPATAGAAAAASTAKSKATQSKKRRRRRRR